MLNMRESWTDERLDDFAKHVDRRFDEVDRRFDAVDKRLERLEERMDGLHRSIAHGFIAMAVAIVTSNGALIAFVATQL